MATSDFWRERAFIFRNIPDFGSLRADWHEDGGGARHWKLKNPDSWVEGTFVDTAIEGALEIADASVSNLLFFWLDRLKDNGYNVQSGGHLTGSIYRLCEASANFCKKLEIRALQTEFKEKHPAVALVPAPIPSDPEPDSTSPARSEKGQEEIERRRKLLAEDKAAKATGGERNGPIEGGRNQIPHAAAKVQKSSARHAPPSRGEIPTTWDKIEISFLSDNRVQIRNGADTETCNYAEFGLNDGRSRKPSLAWVAMRCLAEHKGVIRDAAQAGEPWPRFEKRIQEIRKVLRNRFRIAVDPIPFVKGTGYEARFKIGCSPSFHT